MGIHIRPFAKRRLTMTRKEIEKILAEEPYCFETDREEIWYEIGCVEGLRAADAEPNLASLWHNASEEPQGDNYKILCVDDYDLSWVEKRANIVGLHNNWDEYTVIEGVKMWAYISDLLPKQFGKSEQVKGGER